MSTPCVQALSIQTSNHVSHKQLSRLGTDSTAETSRRPLYSDQTLITLAAAGNLLLLEEQLDRGADPNKPQPGTGLRPLHFAASRGYLNIVTCLIEAGASVDATDKEGETALLKAAYAGHMAIVEYLVKEAHASTTHQDKDGWTALHNAASSRNHLEMIQFLVERGVPVNARSRYGHTPLINAASKGAIAVVKYLLNETEADPLLRNDFGETAYDAAAAVGSAYLCELLEAAERSCWVDPEGDHPYDSLSMHVTVPVLIYENQRAINSLMRGLGKPTFSPAALGKNDRRTAWSLYPSGEPTTKSHVRLPPLDRNASWFWMNDWNIDYSSPNTDRDGWQYAKSFQDEVWTATAPTSGTGWVRRRRWMRIMKRRIDQQRELLEEIQEDGEQGEQDDSSLAHHASSSTTVSMSLTKAQSVFVGCTTQVQSIETDPEPPSRQPSLEWVRSARSSIASHGRPTYVWEPNEQAPECRQCGRWFNLLVRRHHCRRCGSVVCDKCSNRGVMLPFSHIVQDPAVPLEQHYLVSLQPQRVCDGCFDVLSRPRGSSRASSVMRRTPSAQSIMMECPVCGKGLDEYGSTSQQEQHVQTCLNANTPAALSGIRYVVYKLAPNSALVGQECVICLEEFVQGDTMARLSCLCTFHHGCIHSWFAKGKECPLHSQ